MADQGQAKLRNMLNSYERQLITARRMARYKVRMRLAEGLDPDDPDPVAKRKESATKIAQELYDSLLFYPDANPVVEEIRRELGEALGKKVEFTYPPGQTLRIAVRESTGLRHLDADEQKIARETLRRITGENVDRNLIDGNTGIKTRI